MAVVRPQTSNVFSYTFAGQLGQGTSYLQASNNNPIFNIGGQSWTIECWFKPVGAGLRSADVGPWGAIFSKRLGATATSSYLGYIQATTNRIGFYNGTEYASATTLAANTWNHIAWVFNQGSNVRIFINGTNVMTTTAVTSVVNNEARFYIGKNDGENNQIVGDISNFRMTVGQALYSGESFNVSTYPVQLPNNAIGPHAGGANVAASLTGNVILLTCNDQIIKANGNTTINGFTSVGVVHPHVVDTTELQNYSFANFNPTSTANSAQTSGSFMLTTDSANFNIPSGDFTIECWAYTTTNVAFSGGGDIFQKGGAVNIAWPSFAITAQLGNVYFAGSNTNARMDIGGDGSNGVGGNVHRGFIGTWTPNTWNHIAIVRTGTTYNGYLNGVLGYTETTANTPYNSTGRGIVMLGGFGNASNVWTAGGVSNKSFNGYIADARITRRALYPANTNFTPPQSPLQLHPNTVFLLRGPGNPIDAAGSVTISSNGTGTLFFSTNSPFKANAVANANTTTAILVNPATGDTQGKIYNKFDYQNFGQVINIYPALGFRQGRIYDKIESAEFAMSVPIYNALGQDQGRIYDKIESAEFAMSVPIYNAVGQDQGRIYDKIESAEFAYIPTGGVGGPTGNIEYQFWS
jgi:hypothetical protein